MLKLSDGKIIEKALERPEVRKAYMELEDEFLELRAQMSARIQKEKMKARRPSLAILLKHIKKLGARLHMLHH